MATTIELQTLRLTLHGIMDPQAFAGTFAVVGTGDDIESAAYDAIDALITERGQEVSRRDLEEIAALSTKHESASALLGHDTDSRWFVSVSWR